MPKMWSDAIDMHRRAIQETTLNTVAALVAERGLASVTMTEIAERAGIGRATLYRNFADVDAILLAWHERQISTHLTQLAEVRDRARIPADRLAVVLQAYALIVRDQEGSDLAGALHRRDHVARAEQHLHDFVRELVVEGVQAGVLRSDTAPGELTSYCLHALGAARVLPTEAAVTRLVNLTLDGLRAPGES